MSGLTDPRVNRRKRHLLIDIVVIAMCATIAHADKWKDMRAWADGNEDWLRNFLELPNGVPSHDTLRRTISRLDPLQFQECFFRWLSGLRKSLGGVIAIDGKTLRRSKRQGEKPLHIVSAWAAEQHLTLGQRLVDGKSNEITAIPELLKMLQLKGAIVTIDAMGCQRAIARQIVEQQGDYCLAVKGNQETLEEQVRQEFLAAMEVDFEGYEHQEHECFDKGHGRQEHRYYCTLAAPESLRESADWKGVKSLGMTITDCDTREEEVRFFINSFENDVRRFANAVRRHWGIENSLHWVMDVTFREDESRIRKDHGGENVSWLRRLATSVIKQDSSRKDTVRGKRVRAGYNVRYLEEILNAIPVET